MHRLTTFLLSATLLLFSWKMAKAGTPADIFQSATYSDGDFTLPYRLEVPEHLAEGATVPLIVLLHGAGERGNDNVSQLRHGIPDILAYLKKKKLPAIILAPQCPLGMQWVAVPWGGDAHTMPVEPTPAMKAVMDLVPEIVAKYPVDPARLYLTGLSMGGFGAWDYLQRDPDLFAAAIPICGGGDLAQAPRLVSIPIYAFHGALDATVKPHRSRDMVAAIQAAGGTRVQHTEYPNVGHGAWGPAYKDESLLDWLFQQKKTPAPKETPETPSPGNPQDGDTD